MSCVGARAYFCSIYFSSYIDLAWNIKQFFTLESPATLTSNTRKSNYSIIHGDAISSTSVKKKAGSCLTVFIQSRFRPRAGSAVMCARTHGSTVVWNGAVVAVCVIKASIHVTDDIFRSMLLGKRLGVSHYNRDCILLCARSVLHHHHFLLHLPFEKTKRFANML